MINDIFAVHGIRTVETIKFNNWCCLVGLTVCGIIFEYNAIDPHCDIKKCFVSTMLFHGVDVLFHGVDVMNHWHKWVNLFGMGIYTITIRIVFSKILYSSNTILCLLNIIFAPIVQFNLTICTLCRDAVSSLLQN